MFLLKVTNVRVNFRTVYWCSSEKKLRRVDQELENAFFLLIF